jgi:hypothetical protein
MISPVLQKSQADAEADDNVRPLELLFFKRYRSNRAVLAELDVPLQSIAQTEAFILQKHFGEGASWMPNPLAERKAAQMMKFAKQLEDSGTAEFMRKMMHAQEMGPSFLADGALGRTEQALQNKGVSTEGMAALKSLVTPSGKGMIAFGPSVASETSTGKNELGLKLK